MTFEPSSRRAAKLALVVAHPGHELRLFHWMEIHRPTISVLTCGSRHGECCERLGATRALAEGLGCNMSGWFGEILDKDFYRSIMEGSPDVFHSWIDTLRDGWIADMPDGVVTDGWQLYSVAHDLTHLMTRIAAKEAAASTGRALPVRDYAVVPPEIVELGMGPVRETTVLGAGALARKLDAARAYPDIAAEVIEIVRVAGESSLATETLHEPLPLSALPPAPGTSAMFETFGEQRRSAGFFQDVLRWSHVAPIFAELSERHRTGD